MGNGYAAAYKKLDGVVQRCAVAHAGLDDGRQLLDVLQIGRLQTRFACFHPQPVAFDGVYLAIVRYHSEGLRQTPCRECVGRKARVHQRHGAGKVRVAQIGKVAPQLQRCEHAFVYQCAGR